MNRQSFGEWGIELDDVDFARAMAAAGVLSASVKPTDPPGMFAAYLQDLLKQDPVPWTLPSWLLEAQAQAHDARELARLWAKAIGDPSKSNVRLELGPARAQAGWVLDPTWLLSELARPELGVASAYVRDDLADDDQEWDWPLKVGVFNDQSDPAAKALREQLDYAQKQPGWHRELMELARGEDEVEVLIVPHDLDETVADLLRRKSPVRASTIIILGGLGASAEVVRSAWSIIRARAGCAAIAVLKSPPSDAATWWLDVLFSLSHNLPLDVALHQAAASAKRRVYITASTSFLRRALPSMTLQRIASTLESAHPRAMINLSHHAANLLKLKPGPSLASKAAPKLREYSTTAMWVHETDDATTTAHLSRATREMAVPESKMKEKASRPVESRYIKAGVYDQRLPQGPMAKHFVRGRAYNIDIQIGAKDQKSLSLNEPFPQNLLPPDRQTHRLTVVITEPHVLRQAQIQQIELPASGDSTTAVFTLPTMAPGNAPNAKPFSRIEARIIVLFRNRILQTAILSGTIVDEKVLKPAIADQIRIDPEALVQPMNNLERRRKFDAALILNHTSDNSPTITAVSGNKVSFKIAGVAAALDYFDNELSLVHEAPESYADGLDAPATVKLLRDFAKHGHELFETLSDWIDAKSLAAKDRIQITSMTAEARLPIEFVYDRPAPVGDAPLCKQAVQALREGKCPRTCPGANSSNTVCPLGFWGLGKVIERHAFDKERKVNEGEFVMEWADVSGDKTLDPLAGAMFAASNRADQVEAGGVKRVCSTLAKAFGHTIKPILTWKDWVKQVESSPHALQVLIVHSGMTESKLRFLEIGKGDQLELSACEFQHVDFPEGRRQPIVLLIGCETAKADIEYEQWITKLRRKHAAIVVASGSFILGRHATRVVEGLIEGLKEIPRDGSQTFGEVMRRLRCTMLAKGVPMVLCLSAYGDADWRLMKTSSKKDD